MISKTNNFIFINNYKANEPTISFTKFSPQYKYAFKINSDSFASMLQLIFLAISFYYQSWRIHT